MRMLHCALDRARNLPRLLSLAVAFHPPAANVDLYRLRQGANLAGTVRTSSGSVQARRTDRIAPLAHTGRSAVAVAAFVVAGSGFSAVGADGWAHYGGSLAGDRYAERSSISPGNVARLSIAWIYRTGDATNGENFDGNPSRFRATPILVGGRLVASTGFNRVFALDPATGEEIWTYDPEVDFSGKYSEMFTSRGVAAWHGPASGPLQCRTRVFLGTLDARLVAIDADTGMLCSDFGRGGKWIFPLESAATASMNIP